MAADIEVFYSMIYDLIENTILPEGWQGCENEFKGVLSEKHFKKLSIAFSAAIMKSCKEYIPEILLNSKVPEKFEKFNKTPNLCIKNLAHMNPKQTITDRTSGSLLSMKEKEKEAYKAMLLEESQAVYKLKQRLKFHMSLIARRSDQLDVLLDKIEEVKSGVQNNRFYC